MKAALASDKWHSRNRLQKYQLVVDSAEQVLCLIGWLNTLL